MGSGIETVVINTRERAVSNDINRLQSFLAQGLGEFLREFLDTGCGTDDLDAGAISAENTTVGTPLRAEVINGLWVEPQVGSLSVAVHSGLLYCIDPDGSPSPDDSPYKYVRDVGTGASPIAMTANSSGSTRIDVIECQRQQVVVETDNRDIFNPSTGLFAATTVTKATASALTYRVRAGVPASGFPGTVSGWLPLAVASVPTGTTTNDTITFWDVRPLLNDRALTPQSLTRDLPRRLEVAIAGRNADLTTTKGIADVIAPSGRRLGGRLRRGTPGTDADFIDLTDAANQSSDLSGAVNGHVVSLVLLTPFGLPRWARYTDFGSGTRKPRSPRGIPVLTATVMFADGTPSAPITLPSSCGFAGATSNVGVSIASLQWATGSPDPFVGSDPNGFFPKTPPALTLSSGARKATLTAGVDFPANARAIRVQVEPAFTATSAGGLSFTVSIGQPGVAATSVDKFSVPVGMVAISDSPIADIEGWLTVESPYPLQSPATYEIALTAGPQTGTWSTSGLKVVGWKF